MNKHYDESSFQYAIDMLETDPFHAKEALESYLERYPKDYYARAYYALLLTRINMMDEATNEYNYVIIKSSNDAHYITNYKNMRGFRYILSVVKMKLLAYNNEYQEILNVLEEDKDLFETTDTIYISYYCRLKLGIFDEDANIESYRFTQSKSYSEELFKEHVKKHIKKYRDNNMYEQNEYLFEDDFPIDKIIPEVKKYIPSDKFIFPGYFDNTYFFKYDDCGKVGNEWTNFFTVVCFHGTNNIITMCPVKGYERLPFVDLNYIKEEELNKVNVKKISQIDKFNKRYNRV